MKIPLFDIDWTLLKGKNKVHADSFSYAFEKVYKVKASKYEIESQGRPDSQIMIEILGLHGLNEEDVKKKLKEACKAAVEYFEKHKDEGQYILLPGVKEILEELKKRNFLIGVLSGNIEGIAWGKLEKAGIKKFFDFGSFGNYSHRRIDLVPIALEKAKKLKKMLN